MFTYWVKTPVWLKMVFPARLIWKVPADPKAPKVYVTFDDGPHPVATPIALQHLRDHGAKATFFCLGKNVEQHPNLYNELLQQGHRTGNHTYDHRNGWKVPDDEYFENIHHAQQSIKSDLFRPPYGRIRRSQARKLTGAGSNWKVVMWDVLSGDFDTTITPEQCLNNVIKYIRPGSIVIFHDSEKALPRMQYALPRVLAYCREKGWEAVVIPD